MHEITMIERAKQIVQDYMNEQLGEHSKTFITEHDVYVVWFCKTLQNWKALLSTDLPDGQYFEVTFNGDKDEVYLDVYKKWDNKCVK